jgi:Hydroxymethylpyrimidine/phosphomethylpyrimidine kinase
VLLTAVDRPRTLVGVREVFPIPAEMIASQLDALVEDFDISWAKTGMLFSPTRFPWSRRG